MVLLLWKKCSHIFSSTVFILDLRNSKFLNMRSNYKVFLQARCMNTKLSSLSFLNIRTISGRVCGMATKAGILNHKSIVSKCWPSGFCGFWKSDIRKCNISTQQTRIYFHYICCQQNVQYQYLLWRFDCMLWKIIIIIIIINFIWTWRSVRTG